MLLTELTNTVDPVFKDWQFEVMKPGSNGGAKGETFGIEWFTGDNAPYLLTPTQIKQYFADMEIGDVRIVMAKTGTVKVARIK